MGIVLPNPNLNSAEQVEVLEFGLLVSLVFYDANVFELLRSLEPFTLRGD